MEKVKNGKKSPINETGTRSPQNPASMEVTSNTLIVVVAIATLIVVLVCLELRIRRSKVSNSFPVVENTVAFKM